MSKINLDVEYSKKSLEEVIQHKKLFGLPEYLSDLSPEQYRELVNKEAFFFVDHHNCLRHQFSSEIMATNKQQIDILIEQLQALKETMNDAPEKKVIKTYIGKHSFYDGYEMVYFDKALISDSSIAFDFDYPVEPGKLRYTVSLNKSHGNIYTGTGRVSRVKSEKEVDLMLEVGKSGDVMTISGKWTEDDRTYDVEVDIIMNEE
ncbi:hypothetical protein KKJ06_01560 [Xenorhabdus bovienii]|uniref:hypothetical protein n=1 Tax=Xenorhabdus bovienii TaxID=40576 RepID=UPI0023B2D0E6|nr:hypothetical protein [Xenorhabdus bovienii]MDE9554156.1 hypothetical protein [Xenorhabdus bovienii]